VLSQQLISAAIWILGAILGPLALTSALEGNPTLLLILGASVFLFLIIFVMKERTVVLPVMGLALGGRLNFLPFGLDTVAVLSLGLIFYYFFAYFTMKQRNLITGPRYFFIPILVITAIVVYDLRKLGLYNLLGSGQEGSRGAVMMLLGSIVYFCGISIYSPPRKFLALLPYYCFILSMLAQIPGVISTFFPSTAPILYYITNTVNVDAYKQSIGFSDTMVRYRAVAGLGGTLALFLVCWYPIYTWWRPYRWWAPILFLLCFGFVAPSGFRSDVAGFFMLVMLALWCYFSWRSLLILPLVLAGAYVLSLSVSSGLVPLSLSAQRSLSFLPGKWDPTAVASASSSLDFRANIEKVYIREELYKSPLIGNGFAFDRDQFLKLTQLSMTSETPDGYYQAKSFITAKMFHVGWISLYDALGLIGGAAFLVMLLAMVSIVTYFVSGRDPADPLLRLKIWLFLNIVGQAIGFFTLFGDARTTYLSMCIYSVVLVHLCRLELGWTKPAEPPVPSEREDMGPMEKTDPAPSLLQS
jgi:hypothetical protein